MKKDMAAFINTFLSAIKENNAAIFAGAGLSSGSGYVNWKELMRDIADELGLDVDRESDLIQIAQFYRNSKSGRGEINQKLIDEFTKDVEVNENHNLLAKLPIKTFWTTNYDKLIEQALESNKKVVDLKIVQSNLANVKKGRDAVVYKMHGDISLPNDAVLTKDDYECYNEKRQMFTTALQGDLVSKTFAFWGFSFDDPNLEYILSRIRILLGESRRNHYCFFHEINRENYKDEEGTLNEEEYQYACTKQKLKIEDLKRYSIQAILVESYSDITDAFRIIYKRLKEDKVFISGAAALYLPWETEEAENFIFELSQKIVANKMKVFSGFGLGVGSSVINGVLSYVYANKNVKMEECLVLRPFPQNISDDNKRRELWRKYREDILEEVGIAIFLFGNKLSDTKIMNSEGMYEEFELAFQNGAIVIPIGCTGYESKLIWDKVMEEPKKYYGDNDKLIYEIQKLGEYDPLDSSAVQELVLRIINIVRDKNRKRV